VGVEVDGGAVLDRLLLRVHVEDLDDVRHEVGQLLVELDLLVVVLDPLAHRGMLVAEARGLVAHHLDLVVEQARARDQLVVRHRRHLVPHGIVGLAEDVVVSRHLGD
jgi:hypothetical protein